MATFNFELSTLPPEAEALRDEVRAFLEQELAQFRPADRRALLGRLRPRLLPPLGERGWIGMTWPKKLRRPASAPSLERYVVLEETARRRRAGERALGRRPPERPAAAALRHRGAARALPAAHRARRAVLRHRHERAGLRLRPRLDPHPRRARWTAATRVNGTKIWTSNAHRVGLRDRAVPHRRWCRTRSTRASRSSSSTSSRPASPSGRSSTWPAAHDFNEVLFQDCLRARRHAGRRATATAGSR